MGTFQGGLILVCNEAVTNSREGMPAWAKMIFTVPGDGLSWILSNIERITEQAAEIARSFQDQVFVFSAGPLSNALIPVMWRSNPNNTYIDFGGTLDYSVHGIKTRPFHPERGSSEKPWLRADGSLARGQTCHQTRWAVFYEPRIVPLDVDRIE